VEKKSKGRNCFLFLVMVNFHEKNNNNNLNSRTWQEEIASMKWFYVKLDNRK